MKGDFSKWGLSPADNFSGVLHQQGRVLLDQDWNAAQQIQALWRETAGEDIVGGGLVAVPAAEPDGFRILTATAAATGVTVSLAAGRAWVDGVLVRYGGGVPLRAEYLQPPLQDPPFDHTTIAAGVRDAVVLEVWDEELSAFQAPLELLEPALGGPDTTERVKTCIAIKLLRLAEDQDCGDLDLEDDFGAKGRLTVQPSPTTVVPGPCPVPDSGGYTGFEHFLYRIEIAPPLAGQARFKWSQFNGGLVGRGTYAPVTATTGTVTVTANNQMIDLCGLPGFYLEALAFDPAAGHWRTTLTANATLSASGTLALTNVDGAWPAAGTGFFRLWNGIRNVVDFPTGLVLPNELHEGIRLAFDAPATGRYSPGDYWTFPARAAGVAFDPSVWPTNSPPQGVVHHRAALGVLEWLGPPPNVLSADRGEIHDCRQPFLPLARQHGCCTVTVGDNRHSFGQFASIQAAVNALPPQGGTVCVLTGVYDESVVVSRRVDVRIHGCGPRTRIRAVERDGAPLPAFLIADSSGITLEDIAIESGPRSAVQVDNSRVVAVRRCLIRMRDRPTLWQAIYSRGDDVSIEHNVIEVLPRADAQPRPRPPPPAPPPLTGQPGAPSGVNTPEPPINRGAMTRGGIQLAGGSDRVRIADNIIRGGISNGITLGSLVEVGRNPDDDVPDRPAVDPCDPCAPVDSTDDDDVDANGNPRFRSAGDLYDIEITGNRITDMGINGIGVVRHFNLRRDGDGDMIGVHGLRIADNVIARCLRRDIAAPSGAMASLVAYGGISLSRVTDLRITGNEIVNNGTRPLYAVCGVFAIIVQGLQVDSNRIMNNGPRDSEPLSGVQPGIRGGVHVWIVMPSLGVHAGGKLASSHGWDREFAARVPARTGASTVMIRDNVIVAPVGRSLTVFGLGPMTVARNRLVTQGTTGRGLDLLAATVLVGDVGISNEWTPGLFIMFLAQRLGGARPDDDNWFCTWTRLLGLIDWVSRPMGLWPPISRAWATGKLLISENQVTLDVIDDPIGIALTSVAAFSLDDVALVDNQMEVSTTNVFVGAANFVIGGSVRVADNRFSETWMRAVLSGLSAGLMNTTTDNQATHCLQASAIPSLLVFRDNISFVEAFCPGLCTGRDPPPNG